MPTLATAKGSGPFSSINENNKLPIAHLKSSIFRDRGESRKLEYNIFIY